MKITTYNVNGLRAAHQKGFLNWLNECNPDILCLQETKIDEKTRADHKAFYPEGYVVTYVDALKKGYSGVAIYSKQPPIDIVTTMQYLLADEEGRYCHYEFSDYIVASVYFPSGTSGEHRQIAKYSFLDAFDKHLLTLKAKEKPIIICGDVNIAHREIDLKNWKGNLKNSGFLPKERAWLDKLFTKDGLVDAYRVCHPLTETYTWWTYRMNAYAKNVGWRIDYQLVSDSLKQHIKEAYVDMHLRASDHAPFTVVYQRAF